MRPSGIISAYQRGVIDEGDFSIKAACFPVLNNYHSQFF